jgi:DNA-binding GntR family transcriptional regulator
VPRAASPPTVLPPDPGSPRSLSDHAYFRIRDLIVSLELAPGAIVNERELMERLGVGRTPVREALRTLAQEKLVEVYPRRGIFVAPVDVRDLASLSEVRAVLESHAAALAAVRATPEERDETGALIAELDRAAGEHNERRLIDLDQRVHRHVYRCAHNPFLEKTLEEYYVLALRIWFLALDRVVRLDEAVQEHRELMEAIRAADPDRSEQVMRRHVLGFEQAIRRAL